MAECIPLWGSETIFFFNIKSTFKHGVVVFRKWDLSQNMRQTFNPAWNKQQTTVAQTKMQKTPNKTHKVHTSSSSSFYILLWLVESTFVWSYLIPQTYALI